MIAARRQQRPSLIVKEQTIGLPRHASQTDVPAAGILTPDRVRFQDRELATRRFSTSCGNGDKSHY